MDNWVCWNTGMLVRGVVHVEGGGRVILPLPVPSPCNNAVMVLGTGASFMEGFVSFAEASIITGTRSGGSCSTNCGELHPPTQACQSRTWGSGFLGREGSVVGLQQTRVVR